MRNPLINISWKIKREKREGTYIEDPELETKKPIEFIPYEKPDLFQKPESNGGGRNQTVFKESRPRVDKKSRPRVDKKSRFWKEKVSSKNFFSIKFSIRPDIVKGYGDRI